MASSSSGPPLGPTNLFNGKPTQRTTPDWIDPLNGQLEILLLRAIKEKSLPSNPFLVSKTITSAIGSFNDAKSQRDENNRIQYILSVRNKNHISTLLNINKLIDGTPIEIIYHPTLNQRKFVVTCREVIDMDEKDLLAELTDQRIIAVKRITKWDRERKTTTPTPTLILTIQGTVIPNAIFFGFIRVLTRTFYPNPLQCYRCFQFGHTSKYCKHQTQLCRNCGQNNHISDDTDQTCRANTKCLNCNGNHLPTSRDCPVWIKENLITRIRIDQGISHKEARLTYETQHNKPSYSSQLQTRINIAQNIGCNRCKCNCTVQTPDRTISSTDETTETETSSSESDESDVTMDTNETVKNMKRKIAQQHNTSEEQKTSEDDSKNLKKNRKKPRNDKIPITDIPKPNIAPDKPTPTGPHQSSSSSNNSQNKTKTSSNNKKGSATAK